MRYLLIIITTLIWVSPAQADFFPYYKPTDTIVILGAVPQEIPVIVEQLKERKKASLWGTPYYTGKLHGKSVVVAITGIGETFTAMTTTQFVMHFKPRLVVMSGTAARINQSLRTGDVIVATSAFEHDYGSLTADGMVFFPLTGPVDGNEVKNDFRPPEEYLKLADKAIASYPAQTITANGSTYTNKVRRGKLASSNLFGVPGRRIKQLREKFHVDLMESESAPLGLVCENFGVPYLVVRAGSNLAQPVPNDDYLRLGPIAAREAAKFTAYMIQYL